ncbi:MAG: NRAMP family divalent metal transporter [Gemmatimonadota bacterium]
MRLPRLGTSSVVAAAFIGPGTVLTCATAGLAFGYSLGWTLVFATAAVFVLQSFAAGLGILARRGLGEAIREQITAPTPWRITAFLVVVGLWLGCAAFEVGNLIGATAGLAVALRIEGDPRWLSAVLAVAAGLALLLGLRAAMHVLTTLVAAMSVLFVAAMLAAPVDVNAVLRGLLIPSAPQGSLLTVVALIGTTVVPYNLFLHASATRRYWEQELPPGGAADAGAPAAFRRELAGMAVFIPLGGLISYAILATGAALPATGTVARVGDLARLLEPVAGPTARMLFGLGLFAAGFTSAITAPMAAAEGIRELFGWTDERGARRVRLVWLSVLLTGLVCSTAGWSPVGAIIAAQAANGVLLPLIAAFLLYVTTRRQHRLALPGWYRGLGVAIVLLCAGLGAATLHRVFERIVP